MKNQRELARLLARRDRTPSGLSAPQVQYSSIEDGSLKEYDSDGNLVAEHGKQWDGSHGVYPLTGPNPPRPTAPTVEGGTSATLGWDGLFVGVDGKPDITIPPTMDFSRVEIHISQTQGFRADTADTLVDTIETPRGGSRPALPGPGTWYAVLVSRSLAGKRSEQSPESSFEILPGLTEEDIQVIRDEFQDISTDLNRALEENVQQQQQLGVELDELQGNILPAMRVELADAGERLDSADQLLNVSFPKRISDAETKANNANTTATQAQTKAAAAETAAAKAAADLVTAKQRADAAATAATTAAAEAAAAEASSARATGAAGVAETAADQARQDAAAALTQAQNAGTDVGAAQAAAAAAQTAANTAKTQATSAGTAAAQADAKAAQAAADAAKAAADALTAQQKATTAASEATTAKNSATTAATKATAAETAAAAAQAKATTAASDAAAAATKAAAAETSATKASGAAGTAETAADKARQDAAAALTQAQNSGSNATAAQSAATAAQTAANTAKTQASTAGTAAARADAAAAQAAADAAQAAADLIVARNAAADARGDADTALDRADAAINAAGSTSRVLYSTGNPSGTAREGDTWRKTASDVGSVIAEWRYTKNSAGVLGWRSQVLTDAMFSNVDIGKLTAGSGTFIQAVAEKMAIATAAIQKADIGNLTVTGDSTLNNVVAEKMAAKIGLFVEVKTSQLVADNASFKTGVAERLAAGIGSFVKLSASQVYIGQAGNLIPNGYGEMGDTTNWSNAGIYRGDPAAASIAGAEASFWWLDNINGNNSEWFQLREGAIYRFSVYVRSNVAGKRFYVQLITPDGVDNLYLISNQTTTTAFKKYTSVDFEAPAGATKGRLMVYANHANGTTTAGHQWFAGFDLRERITPALVVDGLVSGQNIIGAIIQTTADANRGVKITDAGLFAFNSSGVETLRFDGANSIITGATIRTATTGARVQLSTVGLEAWGSNNVKYLSATANGLDLIGTVVATGDTTDTSTTGGTAGLYTSRAIVGRRNAGPGVDMSPGFWLEVERNGINIPNNLYPAGLRSTSPYTAAGAVLQASRLNNSASSATVSVEPGGVSLQTDIPYSNGYAASTSLYMSREGALNINGADGYPQSGDTYQIIGTSRRSSQGVGELKVYARQKLDLMSGPAVTNGIINIAAAAINIDGSVFLNGTDMEDSKWKKATYASPWTSYGNGFSPLSYRIMHGVLYIMGSIKGGVSGSRIATLPAGYRPVIPTGTEALEAPLTATQGGSWYAGSLWVYGDGRMVYSAPPGIWSGTDRAIINASFPIK